MSKPNLVGIDPAFRKDGFCVCVIDQEKEVQFKTFKNGLLDFISWLPELPDDVIICVENSNLQNATFGGKPKESVAVKMRRSRNVGANQAASQYTYDVCLATFGKGKVIEVSPKTKGVKWKRVAFLRAVQSEGHNLINYTGSQDQRDAYKLALQAWQFRFHLKKPK